jgi:hypothetical protein
MRFPRSFAKVVALAVAPAFFICVSAQTARATMVATEQVLQATATAEAGARERLAAFLDRADVREVLQNWGVDAAEAHARVNALSDQEATSIASKLDSLPAGGSTIGIIVGALLLIFIVLLITDLLGLTDVFPFIRKRH